MIIGRWRKNNSAHEYVPRRRPVKRGTSKLASIRPIIRSGNTDRYQPGKRITIAIVRHAKWLAPEFSVGGASAFHMWGMRPEGDLTTFTSVHGASLAIASADIQKLLKRVEPTIATQVKAYAQMRDYVLVDGWVGKQEKRMPLTQAQAEKKNSRLRGSARTLRWVPAGSENTVKPYQHSGDLTVVVMTSEYAAKKNAVLARKKQGYLYKKVQYCKRSAGEVKGQGANNATR
ncbi:MAG: hypothetical protein ACPGWR_16015 [Ardenticatenaceae bacterium]